MDVTRYGVIIVSCCLLLSVYAPRWLGAQTLSTTAPTAPEPLTADFPMTLEPVVVTGRAADLTGIAESASEGRVGQAQLETRPFLRPGEVLEVVPGVIVTQHSGTGKANQYFLRGFNLDHGADFSSFVDGVPINFPTHAHGQGYMDLNWLIPELIDYVTFRKGPYYADVGDFSSAGTASFHLFKTLPEGLAKVGIGQDDYYRVLVAHSPQIGPGSLLYAFEANFYNGPWDHNEHVRKFNGVLKYSFRSGPSNFSLGFAAYSNTWDSTDQIPQRAVDQGLISRLGTIDPSDGGRTARYSLYGEWSYKGTIGLTQANAYVTYYRLRLFSNFTFFLDDPDNGDQFEQSDRRVVAGGKVSQTWSTATLGTTMDHTVGVQVRHFWYLQLDSELLFVGDAGITEPSRASRRYGVEWSNFYKPLPWLALDFDMAYSHARFTEDDPAGDYIPGSIETVIAAGATIDVPIGIFGSLRTRYFGPRPLIEDDSVRSKSTTLVNLEAGYKYKNFRAQIDVLNLFDSHRHDIDFPIGGFSPPEGRLARGFKPPAFSRFLFQSAVKSAESF